MREIFFTGPEPSEGAQLCTMCTLAYKAAVLEVSQEQIQHLQKGDGPPSTFSLTAMAAKHGIRTPDTAVGLGIAQALGNALVPLCWSHMSAIKFVNGGLAVAGANDIPQTGSNGQPLPLITGRRG